MIQHLQQLPVERVERFLETRDATRCGIPRQLAEYILQLNEAANLNRRYHNISQCARQLRRVFPALSLATCRSRIYDAINYFNADCSVTAEAWNLYFADQMLALAEVNLVAHDTREARICFERAREYRIAASSNIINPDRLRFRTQLVSADMQLDRMGIQRRGLLDAYNDALNIINSRDISQSDRTRLQQELQRELNISPQTIEYEDTQSQP